MSTTSTVKITNTRPSTLIPVRIDVASNDKTARVIDTLIVDPTCWPIPLYSPLQESVERNIQELAYTVLSDAEVLGMGRTVRHFTGRVDLWSPELQLKVENQLRPQIWAIVNGIYDIVKPQQPGGMIPISIRLMIQGIAIHEDFQWDPSVPVSPMEFAEELGQDLNLPEEAVVAVLISFLEQLYGLTINTTEEESTPTNNSNNSNTAKKRGAWRLDPKDTMSTMTQVVAQHRPS